MFKGFAEKINVVSDVQSLLSAEYISMPFQTMLALYNLPKSLPVGSLMFNFLLDAESVHPALVGLAITDKGRLNPKLSDLVESGVRELLTETHDRPGITSPVELKRSAALMHMPRTGGILQTLGLLDPCIRLLFPLLNMESRVVSTLQDRTRQQILGRRAQVEKAVVAASSSITGYLVGSLIPGTLLGLSLKTFRLMGPGGVLAVAVSWGLLGIFGKFAKKAQSNDRALASTTVLTTVERRRLAKDMALLGIDGQMVFNALNEGEQTLVDKGMAREDAKRLLARGLYVMYRLWEAEKETMLRDVK
jgi:hypothetical protein